MHEMKLRVQVLRPALASGERGALPFVGRASYLCWGSLQERRAKTQVMLEVSQRARWDASLVSAISLSNKISICETPDE